MNDDCKNYLIGCLNFNLFCWVGFLRPGDLHFVAGTEYKLLWVRKLGE